MKMNMLKICKDLKHGEYIHFNISECSADEIGEVIDGVNELDYNIYFDDNTLYVQRI